MNFSFSELISYFGGFLGVVLATVILLTNRGKKEIKISLALFVLNVSVMIFLGALNFSGKLEYFPHLLRVDSPLGYLIGPFLFFYLYSSVKPDFRFRPVHLIHLIPFMLNVVEFLPFYFSNAEMKLEYYSQLKNNGTVLMLHHYILKSASVTIYFIAQLYFFIRIGFKRTDKKKERVYLNSWFVIFFTAQFILLFGVIADQLTGLKFLDDPYRFAMMMLSIFIYIIIIALLFYPRLLYGYQYEDVSKTKYGYSTLTEADKRILLENWNNYNEKEKLYLTPNLTITYAAKQVGVNSQHLSQVINEKTGLSFTDFINKQRVEESKNMLLSKEYSKLTIDAIAEKAGFNSKSPFYSSFKKFTGITPRQFVEQAKQNRK